MSAHFNNDTSHDGDDHDINTTLSTLASTTIPVSKDCVLEMKENEISQIFELFNSNLVNVVVIYISFPNSSHKGQLFSDFDVSLSNPIGREILYALEKWQFRFFPWTLKAGIRNYKLNVNGSQNDCIKTRKNMTDFVLESTQHIVDSINLATNYQVCSSFKETSSGKVKQTCCQMTKPNLATKFNYECPKGNSVLFASDSLWVVIYSVMFYFAIVYLLLLLLVLLSRTEFDLKYPEYYKLEECLMSPSSIFFKAIWDGKGRALSFFRYLVLISIFSCIWFSVFLATQHIVLIIVIFLFFVWGIFVLVSTLLRSKIIDPQTILNTIKVARVMVVPIFWFSSRSACDKRGNHENVVTTMLLLFNPKFWSEVKKLMSLKVQYTKMSRGLFARFCYSLSFFIYVVFFFMVLMAIVSSYPMLVLWNSILLGCRLDYGIKGFCINGLPYFHALGLFFSLLFSVQIIIFSIVSFLLGLFLNLISFIPYFAFFSVLTFYCCTYWKTMEEKYFVLKRLIYEACQTNIPNKHPKPNGKLLPVVCKELYDEIRGELLPYDMNLFYFGLKMVWAIAFSLGIFTLVNTLYKFNVTGLVQVVTTASLGVMPHIFNLVGLKTSEERKKAENENMELNVKYMVELIPKDSKLASTVLMIERDSAGPQYVYSLGQWLKHLFGCYRPDNDVHELATPVSQHSTADDKTIFGVTLSDNEGVDDVEAARSDFNSTATLCLISLSHFNTLIFVQ